MTATTPPGHYKRILEAAAHEAAIVEPSLRTAAFQAVLEDMLRASDSVEHPSARERPRASRSEPAPRRQPPPAQPRSFVDVYRRFSPRTNYEKVVIALFHLHTADQKTTATTRDIQAKLKEIKVQVRALPRRIADLCEPSRGLVMAQPLGKRKFSYELLREGYDLVENRLSDPDEE